MSLFDEMLKRDDYKKLVESLPAEEREVYLKALKEMVDNFELRILTPIKNLKGK